MKAGKLISLILCVAMVFIATPASVYADDTPDPEVYVQSVTVDQGSSVDVSVGIRNAVDLGGLDVSVFYDPDVFTVESAENGYFVNGASASINKNTAGTVKQSIVALDGLNGDGDLMNIRFAANENAAAGDYELAVGIGEAFDISFNNVSISRKPGKITVRKNESIIRDVSFYSWFESNGSVSEGSEVHYRVAANDTNGLAAGTFEFQYDSDVLEYVDTALGSELVSDSAVYSINSKSPGLVKITYAEIEAITTNYGAEFFNVTFKVKQNADTYTNVNFSGSSLLDANLNKMTTSGTSSGISIEKKRSSLYLEWDGSTDGDRKFTVDVLLTGDSNVGAGDFWIRFDRNALSCESVEADASVAASGAYLVTKEDTSSGKLSFSYLNSAGCSKDSTLLHVTFKQLPEIVGYTELVPGGKDVVDKDLKDVTLNYPSLSLEMPYDEGHVEEIIPEIPATCTENGWTEGKVCSVCGKTLEEQKEIPALGHDYKEDEDSAIEPTCETAGKEADQKCSRCDSVIEGKPVDALGHDWGEWTVVKEATEEEEGLERRVCTRDDSHFEERDIPKLNHVHDLDRVEAVGATCTKAGNIEYWTCSKCGRFFSDENGENEINAEDTVIKATGHTEEILPAVAATCTEPGKTEGKRCSVCGEIFVAQNEVLALGHDWGEWTVVKEATEEEEGLERKVCTRDDSHIEERVIPKLDHVHALVKTNAIEPTCTKAGNIEYWTCSKCGKIYSDADGENEINSEDIIVKATGHTEETLTAVAATCTEPGKTEGKKCSVCGEILVPQNEIAALGHDYKEDASSAVEPTCETAGKEADQKCSRCDLVIDGKPIEALGHNWGDWTVTKPATCTEDGEEQKVCSRDNTHIVKRAVEAIGHDWSDWTVTKPATCIEDGEEQRVCSRDNTHIEKRTVEALSHDWGEWTVVKEATEEAEGLERRVCARDDSHIEERTIPSLSHVHEIDKVAAVEATCTKAGNIEYWTCSKCGRFFNDENGENEINAEDTVVKATGHTEEIIPAVAATCTEPGKSEGKKCSVCGEIFAAQTDVAALGHDWGDWTVVKEATEEEEGLEKRVCKRDESHFEERVIPKLDHVHALVKTSAVEPTCTKAGNIEYWTCSKCGKYFSDAEAENELTEDEVFTAIDPDAHDWDDAVYTWSDDNSSAVATRICKNNPLHIETAQGTVEETITPVTEEEDGEALYTAIFDAEWAKTQTKTVVIPKLTHEHEPVPTAAVAATCTEAGNSAYWYCEGCDKYFSDEACTKEIAKDSWVIKALGHEFGGWESYNDDQHKRVCTREGCDETEYEAHTWDEGVITTDPTETTPGEKTFTCTVCGGTKKEEIPPLQHEHEPVQTAAKAATCTEAGNSAYWYCEGCDKYFSDEACTKEIAKDSWVIKALGHEFGDWEPHNASQHKRVCTREGCGETEYEAHTWDEGVITTDPTETTPGEKTFTCTVCGGTKKEEIPPLTVAQMIEKAEKQANDADGKATAVENSTDEGAISAAETAAENAAAYASMVEEAAEKALGDAQTAYNEIINSPTSTPEQKKTATTNLENAATNLAKAKQLTARANSALAKTKKAAAKIAADKAATAYNAAQSAANSTAAEQFLKEAEAYATTAAGKASAADTASANAAKAVSDLENLAKEMAGSPVADAIETAKNEANTAAGTASDAATAADKSRDNAKGSAGNAKTVVDNKKKAEAEARLDNEFKGVADKKIKKVKGLKKSKETKTAITVKWTKLTKKTLGGATKYEIWACTNKGFRRADTKVATVSKSKSSGKVKGLKKNTKYFIRVRAIRVVGRVKYVGPWSSMKGIKTKK